MDSCPYSKDGACKACRVLTIKCDGEKFSHCAQYEIASGKTTPEEIVKRANTY